MNALTPIHANEQDAGLRLPQDVLLEQSILGLCLKDETLIDGIFSACQPEDFYHEPYPAIARIILRLWNDGASVTPLSIGAAGGAELLQPVGGHRHLASLAMAAPAVRNGVTLARQLADMRLRRDAIIACMDAQEALARQDTSVLRALQPALEVTDRAARHANRKRGVDTSEIVAEVLKEAEESAAGKVPPHISTGLSSLDAVLGGLQAGDLCIYSGRPGMGKSSLLLTTMLGALKAGKPAIFFSLEMSRSQLLHRVATDLDFEANPTSPLSYSWFRSSAGRRPTHDQVRRLAEALHELPDFMEIHDDGDLTIHEIAALARSFAARHTKMGVVVIDYLQKIAASDRYKGNKVQEVTEISGAAKALAKRLGWPVVAGAQLNRGVEARGEPRPTLSDLRESGSIEQDADSVIGIYRPGYYVEKRKPASVHDPKYPEWETEWLIHKNRLDLIVLKNRHGAEDVLSCFCEMRASVIRDEKPAGAR